jgi:hypothetical protein
MLRYLITLIIFLIAMPAIGYLVAPAAVLSIVGIDSDPQLDFVLRTLGVALLALVPSVWALGRMQLLRPPVP